MVETSPIDPHKGDSQIIGPENPVISGFGQISPKRVWYRSVVRRRTAPERRLVRVPPRRMTGLTHRGDPFRGRHSRSRPELSGIPDSTHECRSRRGPHMRFPSRVKRPRSGTVRRYRERERKSGLPRGPRQGSGGFARGRETGSSRSPRHIDGSVSGPNGGYRDESVLGGNSSSVSELATEPVRGTSPPVGPPDVRLPVDAAWFGPEQASVTTTPSPRPDAMNSVLASIVTRDSCRRSNP